MRSAAADPQEGFARQEAAETALVEDDQGAEEIEEEQQQQDGGYRLTFTTSSKCFAGTNAQVQHPLCPCL